MRQKIGQKGFLISSSVFRPIGSITPEIIIFHVYIALNGLSFPTFSGNMILYIFLEDLVGTNLN